MLTRCEFYINKSRVAKVKMYVGLRCYVHTYPCYNIIKYYEYRARMLTVLIFFSADLKLHFIIISYKLLP
jgi:hypothetical protein